MSLDPVPDVRARTALRLRSHFSLRCGLSKCARIGDALFVGSALVTATHQRSLSPCAAFDGAACPVSGGCPEDQTVP
jgi:hypothetical protein